MAKGYPDFFGMSIFPQMGPMTVAHLEGVAIATGLTASIVLIQTKGMIYGGEIQIDVVFDKPELIRFWIYVDNSLAQTDVLTDMLKNRGGAFGNNLLTIERFDREEEEYSLKVNRGMSFKDEINIKIQNTTGNDITPTGRVYYGDVV